MSRAAALFLLLLCACRPKAPPPAATSRLPALLPPPPEEVVAAVDGRPITAAEVALQAREAGKSPKDALDDLIRAALLARAADERGLAGDAEVQRRAKEEMVRRFLKGTFEQEVTPQTAVTSLDIKKAYNRIQYRLVHPVMREVQHLLVKTKRAGSNSKELANDPKAETFAAEIRRRALSTKTADEFNQVKDGLMAEVQAAGFELLAEHIVTALQGMTEQPFADAAFQLKRTGEISPVVRTSYGYHVIRLEREIPAEHVTLEQATPRIRQELWPAVREREFRIWVQHLADRHQVVTYPERLQELQAAEQRERRP